MKKRLKHTHEEVSNMIEYCRFLEGDESPDEWDRGYRYGVQHIRQQLEKIVQGRWRKWEQSERELVLK